MAMEREIRGPTTFHWGAVLAGAFTALGVWMFLYALGAAIGGEGGQQGPDTWTAIYTLISPIIAFFVGGLVAARARGVDTRADGALHGVVLWGFGLVIGGFLLATMGAEVLVHSNANANLPSGYFWAVAGAILGSLITAVLGGMTVKEHERIRVGGREDVSVGGTTRREVYP
jgi:hypothetical protein